MDTKFVRTTSAIYKRDERKFLPQHFIVEVHAYKKTYFASSLNGAIKTIRFVAAVQKTEGSATILCSPKCY